MVLLRDPTTQGSLKPTLGLFTAITLIVGSMIGSGIFRLPANMMYLVQDPFWLLMVWVVGGIFTICGALVFAEMAGMFPQAGGQYAYLRESMGRPWAFLYGWTFFWVVQTGIIASVALVFAQFTRRLMGYSDIWDPSIAVLCIVSLSIVNYLGARFGGLVQNVFTIAKVAALALLILFGFLLGTPSHSTFGQTVASAPTGFGLFSAFFSAMLLGLFALDGWPQAAYVSPEIKDPRRNVPRAMLLGVSLVTIIYVLATAVFIYLVDAPTMMAIGAPDSGLGPIAADAAKAFSGETGAKLISAAVMVSTFGTVNAFILTSPRIYYAVAQDGMFPERFRAIHPKNNTPGYATIVQGIWAGLLVCIGQFAADAYTALVAAVVFCIWLFYIPTVIGFFRLRRERPDAERPYRTTLYPFTPILFFIAAILVVGNTFYTNIVSLTKGKITGDVIANLTGFWGTFFVLLGAVAWYVMKRRSGAGTQAEPAGEAS